MRNTTIATISLKGSRLSFALIAIVLLVLTGCGRVLNAPSFNNMTAIEKNSEIVGDEKNEIVGNVNKAIFDSVDRANLKAETYETGVIEKSGMEVKVPEGRYMIFAGMAGNVFVYDEQGDLVIRELFDEIYGVDSLTVDIRDDYTVFFDGGNEGATIMPAETLISNELTPGIWEVGVDIEAGKYSISVGGGVLGHLQVFDPNKEVRVYELIGGDTTRTESHVELVDGQKLKITGINSIQFNPTE